MRLTRQLATLGIAAMTASLLPALPAAAAPATYTVTKTADTADGTCNADCSLREAITAANANTGQDTIVLPAGTYTLTIANTDEDANADGDLDVTDDLIIQGAGAATTIIDADGDLDGDADGDHRVIEVADQFALGLSGVTITGGDVDSGGTDGSGGGGIYLGQSSALELSGVTVTANRSDGYGGGIDAYGQEGNVVVIEDSTIDGNEAVSSGGGFAIDYGVVTVRDSSFDDNTAGTDGGGFYQSGSTVIQVWDTSFDSNEADAGGGAYMDSSSYGPSFQCWDCTFNENDVSGYGGGLYLNDETTAELWRTEVNDNTSTNTGVYGAGLYAYYANLVMHDSEIDGNSSTTGTSSVYGGGLYGEYSAMELHRTPITNNVLTTTTTGYGGGAYVYYGHLILDDSPVTDNTLTVNSSGYGGGVYLEYTQLDASGTTDFDDNTVEEGDGSATTYGGGLYAYYGSADLHGTAADSISVSNNTLDPGTSSAYGGGVYLDEAGLEGSHVEIDGNLLDTASDAEGGGVYNYYGSVQLTESSVTMNTAGTGDSTSGYGGGIYSEYGANLLEGVHLDDNTTTYTGGGYSGTQSSLTLRDSTVARNSAENPTDDSDNTYGGGLSTEEDYGQFLIEGTVIEDNTATSQGGGIMLYDTSVIMRDSIVRNNDVISPSGDDQDAYGGGLSTEYCCSPLHITNSVFEGNRVVADHDAEGGAIYGYEAGIYTNGVTFKDNEARSRWSTDDTYAGHGGAIYLYDYDSPLEARQTLFVGNQALGADTGLGGAIFADGDAQVVLTNSTLSDNEATTHGGGVYLEDDSVLRSTYSTFVGNTTVDGASGGAIYLDPAGGAHAAIRGTIFEDNLAGGSAESCAGDPVVSNGYNVADDDSCGLTVSSDQEDTDADVEGLADNGGPTMTHALPSDSPAVDAGGATCTDFGGVIALTVDQRGAGRPIDGDGAGGAACDVGAYEYAAGVTVVATDAAAAEDGPDTGTFTVTRDGTSGDLTVMYTVTGSATSGDDYTALTGSVVIPDGDASATITVTPIKDAVVEAGETVVVTLDNAAAYAVGMPGSATVTITDHVGEGNITRVAGVSREYTAVEVSRAAFDSADTVVIARSDDFADALAGAPYAAKLDGPILLTRPTALSVAAANEIGRLGATKAVVLGGSAAVSDDVVSELTRLGLTVTRVAGVNRYATAGAIAAQVGGTEVYVAKAADAARPASAFADALGVSALAAFQQRPILLVSSSTLPADTSQALTSLGVTDATIVGGGGAIDSSVELAINGQGVSTDRLFGATRYGTSVKIAEAGVAAGMSPGTVWLASGTNWPDALAAGPAVGVLAQTLLLVHPTSLASSAESGQFLTDNKSKIDQVRFVGGSAALSDGLVAEVAAALS